MEKIRVFCYGNSPRVFKSIIAGKYCGTEVEYVGAQKNNWFKGLVMGLQCPASI